MLDYIKVKHKKFVTPLTYICCTNVEHCGERDIHSAHK